MSNFDNYKAWYVDVLESLQRRDAGIAVLVISPMAAFGSRESTTQRRRRVGSASWPPWQADTRSINSVERRLPKWT
jgi:hypothetical protein